MSKEQLGLSNAQEPHSEEELEVTEISDEDLEGVSGGGGGCGKAQAKGVTREYLSK